MSTVPAMPPTPAESTATVSPSTEFAPAIPDDTLYEVVDGEVVEKMMSSRETEIASLLVGLLTPYLRSNRLGKVVEKCSFASMVKKIFAAARTWPLSRIRVGRFVVAFPRCSLGYGSRHGDRGHQREQLGLRGPGEDSGVFCCGSLASGPSTRTSPDPDLLLTPADPGRRRWRGTRRRRSASRLSPPRVALVRRRSRVTAHHHNVFKKRLDWPHETSTMPLTTELASPALTRLHDRLSSGNPCRGLFRPRPARLYSTDASLYQIEPVGVVVPRTVGDVVATVRSPLRRRSRSCRGARRRAFQVRPSAPQSSSISRST